MLERAERQNLGKKREHQDLDFDYSRYDFKMPEIYEFKTKKGLNEEIIKQISYIKGEPEWMLNFRLKAYEIFKKKTITNMGTRPI
jgi:Fe-S cluster assembly protein SufB